MSNKNKKANKNNFNLDDFMNEKIVVNCKTEEMAKDFLNFLYNQEFKWYSGSSLFNRTYWDRYKEDTIYSGYFNKEISFGDIPHVRLDKTIVEWKTNISPKDLLEDFMVVEYRNGSRRLVLDNTTLLMGESFFSELENFDENLFNSKDKDMDIMKIFKPQNNNLGKPHLPFKTFINRSNEEYLIWERPIEAIKEDPIVTISSTPNLEDITTEELLKEIHRRIGDDK